ncbi:MAG: response regulator [Coriobacteriales bacterium]|jgi:response regulator RpfG family c-di-GMP phosphodiesterase|nr:response regulator [Coriobacteriales bacterium]
MHAQYRTIFVVDEDERALVFAKESLSDTYNVIAANSARTLLLLLENIIPDLIVLDIELTDMNAFRLIDALKRSEVTENIPIITLLKSAHPEYEKQISSYRATDWLVKPVTKEMLVMRIEKYLLAGVSIFDSHRA